MHSILPEEAEEILALFEEWSEVDRSTASSHTGAPPRPGVGLAVDGAAGAFP